MSDSILVLPSFLFPGCRDRLETALVAAVVLTARFLLPFDTDPLLMDEGVDELRSGKSALGRNLPSPSASCTSNK